MVEAIFSLLVMYGRIAFSSDFKITEVIKTIFDAGDLFNLERYLESKVQQSQLG